MNLSIRVQGHQCVLEENIYLSEPKFPYPYYENHTIKFRVVLSLTE